MPDEFPAKDGAVPTLINFRKRRKAWEVINDMKRWHVPYNLDEIPSIQAYIGDSLNSISDATESGFWEKSLQLEPRKTPQTEDEKMAQLLEEHGFL
jgi:son of sevenless-like protein